MSPSGTTVTVAPLSGMVPLYTPALADFWSASRCRVSEIASERARDSKARKAVRERRSTFAVGDGAVRVHHEVAPLPVLDQPAQLGEVPLAQLHTVHTQERNARRLIRARYQRTLPHLRSVRQRDPAARIGACEAL
jgi:hypothetical protein